jgi:hypothetical protein
MDDPSLSCYTYFVGYLHLYYVDGLLLCLGDNVIKGWWGRNIVWIGGVLVMLLLTFGPLLFLRMVGA